MNIIEKQLDDIKILFFSSDKKEDVDIIVEKYTNNKPYIEFEYKKNTNNKIVKILIKDLTGDLKVDMIKVKSFIRDLKIDDVLNNKKDITDFNSIKNIIINER
jgi:hypothetical protein